MTFNKKTNERKPKPVEGIVEKIELGEFVKSDWIGLGEVRVSKIHVGGTPYTYVSGEKDFPVKEGDNVFFRAIPNGKEMKIINKSLGLKLIPKESLEAQADKKQPELSSDLLKKFEERNNKFKISDGSADWIPKGARIKVKP